MKKRIPYIFSIPVILVLTLIPLVSIAKKYTIGLSDCNWFGDSLTSVDIFLYWKGRGLIFLAALMLVFLIIRVIFLKKSFQPIGRKMLCPELFCAGIYILFVLLSSCLSKFQSFSFWGSYEQWEGFDVIAGYIVVFFYTYMITNREKMIRLWMYAVLIGSFFMGLIGAMQFLQMDIFRTDFGQVMMNLLSEVKMEYSFNFSLGWIYATLYNPNYVGSYAALVLPIVVVLAAMEWKKIPPFFTILAMITTCLMTITLLGSESLTGCVGVIASIIALIIFFFPKFYHNFGMKKIGIVIICCGILCGVVYTAFPEPIDEGLNKLFHPTQDYHVIQKMLSTEKGLQVTTVNDDVFYLVLTGERETPFTITDTNGNALEVQKNTEKNYVTFTDKRFDNIRLYDTTVTVNLQSYDAVTIFNPTINKKWTIANVNGIYQVYNAFNKLDLLKEIPAAGFTKQQHFGDKRGYIWSRTFPLLNQYLLVGSGPSTFTMVFPNDDYIGKTNMNYDGVTVTKPHNMYLQMWVQTGLISLLAFLALVFIYLFKSVRLYWNKEKYSVTERFGVAVMFSVFGYMVTGIANDSTVAVAPVFWVLLGVGCGINHYVKKIDRGQPDVVK